MHGRFSHSDLYEMPVTMRNFYYKLLIEHDKKTKQEIDAATNKGKNQTSGTI